MYIYAYICTTIQVQIWDEAVCISRCANTLGKGMNPTFLCAAMGKKKSNLDMATSLGEGKF